MSGAEKAAIAVGSIGGTTALATAAAGAAAAAVAAIRRRKRNSEAEEPLEALCLKSRTNEPRQEPSSKENASPSAFLPSSFFYP
jgi:hypothetical protein